MVQEIGAIERAGGKAGGATPGALARTAGRWRDRLAATVLVGLWAVTLVGVAGFAVFGVNPGLLARFPDAVPVYAAMYRWMPVVQVVTAFGVIAVLLWVGVGWKWLAALGAVYGTSLAMELAGTTWGIPFGEYGYRTGLGPMWLDRVPAVIPLSWFYMAVPSYALVRAAQQRGGVTLDARAAEGRRAVWMRIVFGAALLTAWDLSLDPAMSAATSFWWWGHEGWYYGMPMLNVVGWFVTSLLLMAALRFTGADRWLAGVPTSWMASFYGANLVLAAGMAAAAGMWGAVAVTLLVIVLVARLAMVTAAGAR